MAKSDLLKEAIADAKAVKETALANAKIALQEAFYPRIQSQIAAKLAEELEDEEEVDVTADAGMEPEMGDMPAEEPVADDNTAGLDVGDLSIDVDQDGEFDEFDIMARDGEMGAAAPGEEEVMSDEEMNDEFNEELNLEAIIRELEEDLNAETDAEEKVIEGMYSETDEDPSDEHSKDMMATESIDEIIEAILREEEEGMMGHKHDDAGDAPVEEGEYPEKEKMEMELQEAYATVKQLQGILSEVNLLNAKLLYTNKLFRNFELTEDQKMKVIENFDRAGNTREVKLVFTTLAESFNRPATKKRVVKESYASKAAASTAPSKETTQVLSEGFELANRWKKLAGLL